MLHRVLGQDQHVAAQDVEAIDLGGKFARDGRAGGIARLGKLIREAGIRE